MAKKKLKKELKEKIKKKIIKIGNLCAKNSASSFSLILNQKVIPISINVETLPLRNLLGIHKDDVVIVSNFSGKLNGVMIVSFKYFAAKNIINSLLNRDLETRLSFDKKEDKAYNDYIRIIAGAFLEEFSNQLKLKTKLEKVEFKGEFLNVEDIMKKQFKELNDNILLLNSRLSIIEWDDDACFHLLFDNQSLKSVLKKITKEKQCFKEIDFVY